MNPPRFLLVTCLALLVAPTCASAPRRTAAHASPRLTQPARVSSNDIARRVDINRLNMMVSNLGSVAYDMQGNFNGGLFYPNHTTKTAIYAAGLWIGARVGGTIRLAVAEYDQEYQPGRIVAGVPENSGSTNLIVYKVKRWSGVPADSAHVDNLGASPALGEDPLGHHAWSEYVNGAKPSGAPTRIYRLDNTATPALGDSVNVEGPDVAGDQMTWCVYNDAEPLQHRNEAGSTAPLGVEVRQTVYSYDQPGTLGNVTFLRYDITNKGSNTLDSTYVSLWSDPDLGTYTDDLTGCDPARSLGYVYNSSEKDGIYGVFPAVLGMEMLRGPVRAPGDTLPMTAFTRYINGTDPLTASASYNFMKGMNPDGSLIIDPTTSLPTRYMFPGDPVSASGWLDTSPADRRMSVSMGPFTMLPGQSQTVVLAIIAIQCGSRLQAISELEYESDFVRNFYRGSIPNSGLPDLVAAVLKTGTEVRQGCMPFDASVGIRNGGGAASGPFTSTLHMLKSPADALLTTFATTGLRAGESFARIVPAQVDDKTFAGVCRLRLNVDDPPLVSETFEFNNTLYQTLEEPTPSFRAIADVIPDQGHQVRLTIAPSSRDIEASLTPILQYELYRQIDAQAAMAAPADRLRHARSAGMISDERALLAGWDYVGSIPAHGETEYSAVAPTLRDSSASGTHATSFMARAATATPTIYFDSCPTLGHSVDNLAPSVPGNFRITGIGNGPTILLAWDASPEPDVQSYALHRGTNGAFVPGPSNAIATVSGQSYTDPAGAWTGPTISYKLAAVDFAGNHSAYALATTSVTAVAGLEEAPKSFSFSIGEPNPARQRTAFRFDVAAPVPVTLLVFDVAGRVVRTAYRAVPLASGRYEWAWDGRDDHGSRLGAGLYLVRFDTPRYRRTVRAILLGSAP